MVFLNRRPAHVLLGRPRRRGPRASHVHSQPARHHFVRLAHLPRLIALVGRGRGPVLYVLAQRGAAAPPDVVPASVGDLLGGALLNLRLIDRGMGYGNAVWRLLGGAVSNLRSIDRGIDNGNAVRRLLGGTFLDLRLPPVEYRTSHTLQL